MCAYECSHVLWPFSHSCHMRRCTPGSGPHSRPRPRSARWPPSGGAWTRDPLGPAPARSRGGPEDSHRQRRAASGRRPWRASCASLPAFRWRAWRPGTRWRPSTSCCCSCRRCAEEGGGEGSAARSGGRGGCARLVPKGVAAGFRGAALRQSGPCPFPPSPVLSPCSCSLPFPLPPSPCCRSFWRRGRRWPPCSATWKPSQGQQLVSSVPCVCACVVVRVCAHLRLP